MFRHSAGSSADSCHQVLSAAHVTACMCLPMHDVLRNTLGAALGSICFHACRSRPRALPQHLDAVQFCGRPSSEISGTSCCSTTSSGTLNTSSAAPAAHSPGSLHSAAGSGLYTPLAGQQRRGVDQHSQCELISMTLGRIFSCTCFLPAWHVAQCRMSTPAYDSGCKKASTTSRYPCK